MSSFAMDHRPYSRTRPATWEPADEDDHHPSRSAKRPKLNALEPISENTRAPINNSRNANRANTKTNAAAQYRNQKAAEKAARTGASDSRNSQSSFNFMNTDSFADESSAMDVDSRSSSPMSGVKRFGSTFGSSIDLTQSVGWAEYAADIFENLRSNEAQFQTLRDPAMIEQQTEITPAMRAILIDWLVEVVEEYKLSQQTLFLAVSYVDRILAKMLVMRSQLQLVGVSCLILASKYEEIYPPTIDDFVYIADETYTRKQILDFEKIVLNCLAFKLSSATCADFVGRFLSSAGDFDHESRVYMFTNYLVELTLGDFSFSKYLPSQIAAAAVCLSMYTMFGTFTNKRQFEQYTEYSVQDLRPCIAELYAVHKRQFPQPHGSSHPLMALYNKFNRPERGNVSAVVSPMQYFPNEL